jgi:tubulin polyglutamylase TTLL9
VSSDVHLTNVAIQKKGEDYDAESGGKWDVRSLKLYLMAKYGLERVNALFFNIQLICIRSLLSVQKVIISDKHSFEMYGYDILIDADLKPWLIEVNASPSLSANTPKDYQMKLALLHDTIAIVDMEKKLTGSEDQVGGYDLIYRNGFVKFNHNCTFTTYLGCHNNRDKQLKRMWKAIKKKKQEQQHQAASQTAAAQPTPSTQSGATSSSSATQSNAPTQQGGANTQGSR